MRSKDSGNRAPGGRSCSYLSGTIRGSAGGPRCLPCWLGCHSVGPLNLNRAPWPPAAAVGRGCAAARYRLARCDAQGARPRRSKLMRARPDSDQKAAALLFKALRTCIVLSRSPGSWASWGGDGHQARLGLAGAGAGGLGLGRCRPGPQARWSQGLNSRLDHGHGCQSRFADSGAGGPGY